MSVQELLPSNWTAVSETKLKKSPDRKAPAVLKIAHQPDDEEYFLIEDRYLSTEIVDSYSSEKAAKRAMLNHTENVR